MHLRYLIPALAFSLLVANTGVAAPTVASVGDPNSFGRSLVWLGVFDSEVDILPDCTGLPTEAQNRCVVAAPAPATTSFAYTNLNSVTLPANSANSLICQWFSPLTTVEFFNTTAAAMTASINWVPSVTIVSNALNNPALINPLTGQPFNGQFTTYPMGGGGYWESFTLAAGDSRIVTNSVSRVCIAGIVEKQALMQTYGLTSAKADDVFSHAITIQFNLSGSVAGTSAAYLYFGMRLVGD